LQYTEKRVSRHDLPTPELPIKSIFKLKALYYHHKY